MGRCSEPGLYMVYSWYVLGSRLGAHAKGLSENACVDSQGTSQNRPVIIVKKSPPDGFYIYLPRQGLLPSS